MQAGSKLGRGSTRRRGHCCESARRGAAGGGGIVAAAFAAGGKAVAGAEPAALAASVGSALRTGVATSLGSTGLPVFGSAASSAVAGGAGVVCWELAAVELPTGEPGLASHSLACWLMLRGQQAKWSSHYGIPEPVPERALAGIPRSLQLSLCWLEPYRPQVQRFRKPCKSQPLSVLLGLKYCKPCRPCHTLVQLTVPLKACKL